MILADQPLVAAERDRRRSRRASFPQVQRRQVQSGGPALGSLMKRRQVVFAEPHAGRSQQRGRLLAGQRQVTRADLGDPAFRAQPRDPQRRLVPARQHQPRSAGDMVGQHRQRVPAFGLVQQVHVIQHQHQRRGHRPERRPQPWHHGTGHRTHRRGQRLEHPIADRLHPVQCFGHVAEQDLRVVVVLVERHPGEGLATAFGPLRQQGGLPVARRCDQRHDRAEVISRQLADQRRPGDRSGAGQRTAKLRRDRFEPWPGRMARPGGPLAYVGVLHAPQPRPGDDVPFHALA